MYENKNNNMKNFMIYSSSYLQYIIKHTLKGIILNETKMLMKKHSFRLGLEIYPKLYIPSTLNIDLIMWHKQLIVCAEN